MVFQILVVPLVVFQILVVPLVVFHDAYDDDVLVNQNEYNGELLIHFLLVVLEDMVDIHIQNLVQILVRIEVWIVTYFARISSFFSFCDISFQIHAVF